MNTPRRTGTVAALGIGQTLAWASSFYLPAILAVPIARAIGVAVPTVFAAFSLALILSAIVGPSAGRAIDRHGGRPVLAATSLAFAAGLALLAAANGPLMLFAAWAVIGVAMGAGLYEAAFATLVRLYGRDSRNAITGVTLMAGFASTVGWPLSAWLDAEFGWRLACLSWAGLHLLVGLPLNIRLPRSAAPADRPTGPAAPPANGPSTISATPAEPAGGAPSAGLTTALLAFVFAVTWFISTAMAAHLPRMMQAAGASLTVAVAVGALVGPAQVAGRLLEFGLLRHVHPMLSARAAALAHPAAVVALLAFGPAMAPVFAVLHGTGNGILTIAKGTLPLVLFGPDGYGARQGWLSMPARVAQAVAPYLFGIALARWQDGALWLTGGLGLSAFAALMLLRGDGPVRTGRD